MGEGVGDGGGGGGGGEGGGGEGGVKVGRVGEGEGRGWGGVGQEGGGVLEEKLYLSEQECASVVKISRGGGFDSSEGN